MVNVVALNPQIQGKCVYCGTAALELDPHGVIVCTEKSCKQKNATAAMLEEPETAHVVKLTSYGFKIRHPIWERVDDNLFECELDNYLSHVSMAPQPPGTYRVRKSITGEWKWDKK